MIAFFSKIDCWNDLSKLCPRAYFRKGMQVDRDWSIGDRNFTLILCEKCNWSVSLRLPSRITSTSNPIKIDNVYFGLTEDTRFLRILFLKVKLNQSSSNQLKLIKFSLVWSWINELILDQLKTWFCIWFFGRFNRSYSTNINELKRGSKTLSWNYL